MRVQPPGFPAENHRTTVSWYFHVTWDLRRIKTKPRTTPPATMVVHMKRSVLLAALHGRSNFFVNGAYHDFGALRARGRTTRGADE